MVHHYTRGDGTLFACPGRIVYLPQPLSGAQIGVIWEELLAAPASLIGTLEVISKELDPTFETLPDFIAIHFGQSVGSQEIGPHNICVALRGDVSLSVATDSQEEFTFTGAGATMWREESAQNVTMLGVGNLESATLPLVYGVSYSDGFIWTGAHSPAELPADQSKSAEVKVPVTPDLGETLTELPEEWLETQVPQSTAPPLVPVPLPSPAKVPPPDTAVLPPAPALPATAVMDQPYFGSVHFAHGQEVDLGGPIVVGRKPSIAGSGAQPGAILVTVPSPSKDISRNHLGIHVEQAYVIATDLGSVNGSVLKRGGQPDRKLNPREGTLILNGDILDLGDNVILSFNGIT